MNDRKKEKALEPLLARTLPRAQPPGPDCPDANQISAYYDRSISPEESTSLETHFSLCPRCQEVLAGLVTAEIEAVAAAAVVPARAAPASRDWALYSRWLTPAAATAVVALFLWISFRPEPAKEPVLMSRNETISATQAPSALERAKPAESSGAAKEIMDNTASGKQRVAVQAGGREGMPAAAAPSAGRVTSGPGESRSRRALSQHPVPVAIC